MYMYIASVEDTCVMAMKGQKQKLGLGLFMELDNSRKHYQPK